jgi:very-short-patch-repair endonuclease
MLIVELDGSQHSGTRYDLRRTDWLRRKGWRVVRFWDHDVLMNTAQVLQSILLNL